MKKLFLFVLLLCFSIINFGQETHKNQRAERANQRAERSRKRAERSKERAEHFRNNISNKQHQTKTFLVKAGNKNISFIVNVRDLNIQAYDGAEIEITATGIKPPNKRAEGLMPMYASQVDNTGVGLNLTNENGKIEFKQVGLPRGVKYKIKVPRKNNLSIKMGWLGKHLMVTGCNGEIEIDAQNGNIKLEDVQGPVVANTVSGDIEVKFSKLNPKGPSSITSISGFVDVTLPKSAKANLKLNTISGQFFVANAKIFSKKESKKNEDVFLGHEQKAQGKMNGGGVDIALESISGDVYLREK